MKKSSIKVMALACLLAAMMLLFGQRQAVNDARAETAGEAQKPELVN